MWRDALLIARRDLTIEMRSKVGLWQILPFGLLALFLFAFALGPRSDLLEAAAPGLFWLAVLFSSILAAQRSLNIEGSPATREANRLLGLDPAGVFLGKAAAMVVELLLLEMVLLVGIVLLFHVKVAIWAFAVPALVLPAIGLSAAGVLYGSLAGGASTRSTLLPILVLPVEAPVLIAASKSLSRGLGVPTPDAGRWLLLLAIFAAVYTVLGVALYGPLEES
jgi:heme exporter protein B